MASFDITIAGQVITFPGVNQDPNWAQAIVEFAQAVAEALEATVGTYDVVPQIYTMTANSNSNVDIPALSFPTGQVQATNVRYSIFRQTTTNSEAETGTLQLVYNPNGGVGEKWEMSRSFVGSSTVSFAVDDSGQISFSSSALSGSDHIGRIAFSASSLQQSYS